MATTIVGIGVSAGGVDALTELFAAMPRDTGLAFVVVQQAVRGRPSMIIESLDTHTPMPVTQISSGVAPAPNTVYVVPSGFHLSLEEGVLTLTDSDEDDRLHSPIDLFFRSLAEDQGSKTYAIVLSVTGGDGTIGIEAVKSAGGVVLAQLSESTRFANMPNNAAETGLIDFKLPPRDIPGKLVELEKWRKQTPLSKSHSLNQSIEAQLPEILDQVDCSGDSCFHHYKPGTLTRRILRRMMLRHISRVDEYIDLLRTSADEQQELAQDFLIGVTQFFRNPDMFEIIENTVLPDLLRRDKDEFRIWCPGCSSGEEVFSLAILISELQERTGDQRPWKLFGTDINPDALATARRGVYDRDALAPLSSARLERFFDDDHGLLTVSAQLRSMCVFARHNVLTDPPFSRVDLISCRNLMIYVDQMAQEDIISRFHYALNPYGLLWLGPSENLSGNTRLFETLDRQARIFRRDDSTASPTLPFLSTNFTSRLPKFSTQQPDMALTRRGRVRVDLETETEQAFLSSLAPPFVRISQHDEVLYASEAARLFLRPAKGIPSPVFEDYFIESVRMPLRRILKEVRQTKADMSLDDVVIEINGESHLFDLQARPLDEEAKSVLVAFQPVRLREPTSGLSMPVNAADAIYEAELTMARKRLITRERDFKMAEQELWASNEELLTINEELQSSNEELESSREELQSVNADLEVINSELVAKNMALDVSNNNLNNLIEAVDIAIMFVDRQGLLKLFTPRSTDLFSIKERDVGRPIFDLVTTLDYPQLKEDLGQPAQNLKAFSREISTQNRRQNFVVKIRPYLDIENKVDGVVVSFFEITEQLEQQWALRLASQQLARRLAELEAFYERAPIGAAMYGPDMRYLRVNDALANMLGRPASDIVGRHPKDFIPIVWKQTEPVLQKVMKTKEPVLNFEINAPLPSESDEIRTWIASYFPIAIGGGDTVEIAVTTMDITPQKRLEQSLTIKQSELQEAGARILRNFEHMPFGITIHQGPDHVIVHANQEARKMFGTEDPIGKRVGDFIPENYSGLREIFNTVYKSAKTNIDSEVNVDITNARGEKVKGVFRRIVQPYRDLEGNITGVMSMTLEVSELVAMRDANAQQTLRQASIIEALDAQIILVDHRGAVLDVNHSVTAAIGKSKTELIGVNFQYLAGVQMTDDAVDSIQDAMKTALKGKASRYYTRIVTPVDETPRRVLISVSPVNDSTGAIREVLITMTDQTALLEATDRKDILVAELEHRVKNVIATIQAVAQFTASTALDPQIMVEELNERLAAMARTHDKLTASGWQRQTFREILELELNAYASAQSARVFCDGDDISLSPSTAMLVGLAIHELLTNAVKYGALSNDAGEVRLYVEVNGAALKRLTWTERGGPKVIPVNREGFGTLLLRSILPSELRVSARISLEEEGLIYELSQ
ncbi:MAG: CheR family methyltransferase [Pelagibaca sp.]